MSSQLQRMALSFSLMLALTGCVHSTVEAVDEITSKSEEMMQSDEALQDEQKTQGEETTLVIEKELEGISEPSIQGPTLVFGVQSFGCTNVSDFHVEAREDGGRCLVEIIRDKRDFCKKAPSIKTLRMPWEAPAECADLPVEFANPLLK